VGPAPFGQTWWGRAWVAAIEQRAQLDPNRLPRAVAYARSGAVTEWATAPGEVRASVEGRDSRPYDIRIRVRTFDDAEWGRVFDAIGARVAHTAAMLDGQLPPEVSTDLEQIGLSLLPGAGEIGPRCSCPDEADPCKHSAAVCYLVADALDADPFVALLLRGRTRAEVLAGLRSRRRDLDPDRSVAERSSADRSAADRSPLDGISVDGTSADGSSNDRPPAEGSTAEGSTAEGQDSPPPVADQGSDAREVLAASAWAPVPAPPAPPRRPGRPVAWPMDPPEQFDGLRSDLVALAADAAKRAWELAVGISPDAGLSLGPDADLARRAEGVLGTRGFAELAVRSGVRERDLARWALAWRHGGAAGFEVLRERWNPATEADARHLLPAARAALEDTTGATARVQGDRVTAGNRQLRFGRDLRWHPYLRIHRVWEPAGPADADPAVAVRLGSMIRARAVAGDRGAS
jgi:uncharacterized Zn finger protein